MGTLVHLHDVRPEIAKMAESVKALAVSAKERRAAVERDLCPTCTPAKNASCVFRGMDTCRIKPELLVAELRERRTLRLEVAGVPREFWPWLLDATKLLKTDAMERIQPLLRGDGDLLVLGGPAGQGKSAAAAFVVASMGGYFVPSTRLADVERRDPDDAGVDPIWLWRKSAALAIDDVGDEHSPSGWAASQLRDLVRERRHRQLVTVLTTNLKPSCSGGCRVCFACRYGEKLVSRVVGAGGLGFQLVQGPDLRRQRR